MQFINLRWDFVNKTARKPEGKWAIKHYNCPYAHYRSFELVLQDLNLQEKDVYCEIGCGGGILLNMAMSRVKEGKAIDHSKDMVELAMQNNHRYIEEGKLEIIQGNVEQLPWSSSYVTACASANMFFFVEQPKSMLREVFRILAPGGRFSMVTINNGFWAKITFGWLYALKLYSNSEMALMLTDVGFSNVKVRTVKGLIQVCYGEKTFNKEVQIKEVSTAK